MAPVTRRTALAGLVSTAFVGHARADAAAPVPMQTPLQLLPTGDIGVLLAARVGIGSETLLMVLDTGATSHLVDPQASARLALQSTGSAAVALPGGRTSVRRLALPPLQFGAARAPVFADQQALEIDLAALRQATGADVRGLLGMPLWAQRAVSFDLLRSELRFDESTPSGSGTFELPLQLDSGLPTVAATLSPQVQGRFLFDTGNAGAVLLFAKAFEQALKQAAQALTNDTAMPQITVQELGGSVSARYARSRRTAVADYTRSDVPVALELGPAARRGGHFDRLAGSLGNALFDGGSIWLNVRAGRLVVQHPGAGTAVPGGFGFAPLLKDGGLVLGSIFGGGPAASAGLLPGDRITALDGVAVASAPACWQHLRGREETVLALQRNGQAVQATLRRASFFALLG